MKKIQSKSQDFLDEALLRLALGSAIIVAWTFMAFVLNKWIACMGFVLVPSIFLCRSISAYRRGFYSGCVALPRHTDAKLLMWWAGANLIFHSNIYLFAYSLPMALEASCGQIFQPFIPPSSFPPFLRVVFVLTGLCFAVDTFYLILFAAILPRLLASAKSKEASHKGPSVCQTFYVVRRCLLGAFVLTTVLLAIFNRDIVPLSLACENLALFILSGYGVLFVLKRRISMIEYGYPSASEGGSSPS